MHYKDKTADAGGHAEKGARLRPSGITGTNPAAGMCDCLLLVLSVFRERCLRRDDPSSTEVLPSVCVILNDRVQQ